MQFCTGRNTVRGGLGETADGNIQRDTGQEENREEPNKESADKGSVQTMMKPNK